MKAVEAALKATTPLCEKDMGSLDFFAPTSPPVLHKPLSNPISNAGCRGVRARAYARRSVGKLLLSRAVPTNPSVTELSVAFCALRERS